jgi:hypothetical protein
MLLWRARRREPGDGRGCVPAVRPAARSSPGRLSTDLPETPAPAWLAWVRSARWSGRSSTGGVRGAGGFIVAVHGRWSRAFGPSRGRWSGFRHGCPPGRGFSCSTRALPGPLMPPHGGQPAVPTSRSGDGHLRSPLGSGGPRGKALGTSWAWLAGAVACGSYAALAAILAPAPALWLVESRSASNGRLSCCPGALCVARGFTAGRLAVVGCPQLGSLPRRSRPGHG